MSSRQRKSDKVLTLQHDWLSVADPECDVPRSWKENGTATNIDNEYRYLAQRHGPSAVADERARLEQALADLQTEWSSAEEALRHLVSSSGIIDAAHIFGSKYDLEQFFPVVLAAVESNSFSDLSDIAHQIRVGPAKENDRKRLREFLDGLNQDERAVLDRLAGKFDNVRGQYFETRGRLTLLKIVQRSTVHPGIRPPDSRRADLYVWDRQELKPRWVGGPKDLASLIEQASRPLEPKNLCNHYRDKILFDRWDQVAKKISAIRSDQEPVSRSFSDQELDLIWEDLSSMGVIFIPFFP